MAAPKYLPKLASSLAPVFKSTVRGTFKLAQKSKEAFAEATSTSMISSPKCVPRMPTARTAHEPASRVPPLETLAEMHIAERPVCRYADFGFVVQVCRD